MAQGMAGIIEAPWGDTDCTHPRPPVTVDLRSAAESADRETRLAGEFHRLESAAAAGLPVCVLWPADRDLAACTRLLGTPAARYIVDLARESGADIDIHLRAGIPSDFETLAPVAGLALVFHVNGEGAALRWERADAAPSRRMAAASRLVRAGWNVTVAVGAVRVAPGWKDDLAEMAESVAGHGLEISRVYFPGEHAMEPATGAGDGGAPFINGSGEVVFAPTPRQRREALALLGLAPVAARRRTRQGLGSLRAAA